MPLTRMAASDYFEPSMLGGMALVGDTFGNLEADTVANTDFRRVLATTHTMQLVLMALPPGESIGAEVHDATTQFMRVEQGIASVRIGQRTMHLQAGVDGVNDWAVVPPGTRHDVINTSTTHACKLYVLYCGQPQHVPGLVQSQRPVSS